MDAAVIARVDQGTVVTVVGGPEVASSYTWWQIRLPDGTEGWAAQNWLRLEE